MPEVKFVKVFRGSVKYKTVHDIESKLSVSTIEAASFPHTEHKLHVIALIKLPPNYHGEISGRIRGLNADLGATGMDTGYEVTWLAFEKQLDNVTFPQPGEYSIEILQNDTPIYVTSLSLVKR